MHAHYILSKLTPPPNSPSPERREFHLRSARVYRRVARVDRGNRFTALAWAEVEQNTAEAISQCIRGATST